MTANTPFESDIMDQPAALRNLAAATVPTGLRALGTGIGTRIVVTGMGSSYFAGIPTWRSLVAAGRAAWSIDTGQLLDTPELLTSNTVLVVTSQSGASGEVVELLRRLEDFEQRPGTVVGIAADTDSPLARNADLFLPLHSGPEATVSTKSYLNTLVVHAQLRAALTGGHLDVIAAEADRIAGVVGDIIERRHPRGIAARALAADKPRVVAVGWRDYAATALFAGLITKESSKVAVEGHVGGQFRHGPFELAGPGLTAFLYGADAEDSPVARLASDLVDTGADVVLVGNLTLDGANSIEAPHSTPLEGLVTGAVVAQLVAVDLALENGVVPGAFAFGSKVTAL